MSPVRLPTSMSVGRGGLKLEKANTFLRVFAIGVMKYLEWKRVLVIILEQIIFIFYFR